MRSSRYANSARVSTTKILSSLGQSALTASALSSGSWSSAIMKRAPACDGRGRAGARKATGEPAPRRRSRPAALGTQQFHRRAVLVGGQTGRELLLHAPPELVEAGVESLTGEALARRDGRRGERQ